MKKHLISAVALVALSSSQVYAASGSGLGCGVWGKVSYLYQSTFSTSLVIINGYACFISGANDSDNAVMSSILSAAEANNKDAIVNASASGVNVGMQP